MKEVLLNPIDARPQDYDKIEAHLKAFFKKYIYQPLVDELGQKNLLTNSVDDLVSAIVSGRIYFYRGTFKGKFNARTSKELKRIGALWDKKTEGFRIPLQDLPEQIRHAIETSETAFQRTVDRIDRKLSKMNPEVISEHVSISDLFSRTIFKVEEDFQSSIRNITVAPKLTKEMQAKIATEYNNNMELYIKDWTEKEIKNLRAKIAERSKSGMRYEGVIKYIQHSYGVSLNKAKFLARQETSLFMSKFAETRYRDAGSEEYEWQCVIGSPNHPVRPMHKKLDRTRQRWDNPPITDENGNRNHPGCDYNCRCKARPIVRI